MHNRAFHVSVSLGPWRDGDWLYISSVRGGRQSGGDEHRMLLLVHKKIDARCVTVVHGRLICFHHCSDAVVFGIYLPVDIVAHM